MTIVAAFIVPMATLCGPLWFLGRKRVQWSWVDFTVAWLPLLVWFGLMRLNLMSKSLSNLGESLIVGGLTPICPAIRLVGREWMTENRLALATAALGIAMAAAVYFFTPCWPE